MSEETSQQSLIHKLLLRCSSVLSASSKHSKLWQKMVNYTSECSATIPISEANMALKSKPG